MISGRVALAGHSKNKSGQNRCDAANKHDLAIPFAP